ncbi:MAG: hypothetical protein PF517_12425, partial [Salinivirgaceae bacterium]|nr:hypothetical protein [Salinivirgaceae bacterium]
MKLFLFIIPFILWLLGCTESERYSNNPKAHLSFSTDTVQFDTVFTTIGTITHQFKFYNRSNEALKTNISLAGGSNSYYRINIDGESTRSINNYEILSNDSVFIFVEATINPQNSNIPMVITDSILFNTNGNQQNVKIVAFGQDVHLYNDSVINSQTWINDKPYLIYHSILVNKHETLTIKEGVQIHFHNESGMIIEGNLNVQGTAEKRVLFQGDRLDQDYKYNPSQWYLISRNERKEIPVGGLFFMPGSKNNVINHAIIKNGAVGIDLFDTIQYDYLKLTLSNSVIENMSNIG